MNPPPPGSFAAIIDALGHGLPMLIVQVVACAILLAIGVAIYMRLTPFHEREMVASGNSAAGTMLATSATLIDIIVWGVVALVLQLLTLLIVSHAMRNFRAMIEAGNVAAAITLAGAQIAVALLNAAAMVPQ